MSLLLQFALITLMTTMSMVAEGALFDLRLKEHAEVSSRSIKLADVYQFNEPVTPAFKQLEGLVVGNIVHGNQPLRLDAKHLEKVILRLQPALAGNISFSGSSAVVVTLQTVELPRKQIHDAVDLFLKEKLQKNGLEFSIQDIYIADRDARVPPGQLSLAPRFDRPFAPSSSLKIIVDAFVAGKLAARIPVEVKINFQLSGYRLTRAIKTGEILSQDDIRVVEVGADESRRGILLADLSNRISNLRLRRNLQAGALLQIRDIEATPEVLRAQEITAEIRTNNIVIEKRVIAEADGILGQKIKVGTPNSTSSFYAKVIAKGRVEVQ